MLKTTYPNLIVRTLFHSIFCGTIRRFILVFCLFTSISLFAAKPVTVIVSLPPLYTPFLNEYTSEGVNQLHGSIIIYVAKGDYLNATFSGIAIFPVAGDAAGKGLKYTIKVIENSSSADKNAVGILRKIPVDQLTKFIKKIYSLPVAPLQRLFKDFIENPVLLEKVALNQKLVDSWKVLSDAPNGISKNIDVLNYVDNLKSAAKFGDDGVESFSGIKGVWNRKFPETVNADGTSKLVRHHAVEQQVLNKYPGIITKKEMHSLDNLRGVPKEINSDLHLRQIRRQWDDFYDSFDEIGTIPTKQQLLDKAKEIDDLLGDQFFPPVR